MTFPFMCFSLVYLFNFIFTFLTIQKRYMKEMFMAMYILSVKSVEMNLKAKLS